MWKSYCNPVSGLANWSLHRITLNKDTELCQHETKKHRKIQMMVRVLDLH